MLAELKSLLEKSGDPKDAAYANVINGILQGRGKDIPFPNGTPEAVNLNAERERQIQNYLALGFHKELQISKETYINSFPKINSQPEEYKGRFNVPVLVETRIDARRQAELAGFKNYIGDNEVKDWKKDRENAPYIAWMQDGTKNKGKSVDNVRKNLENDELAANLREAIALVITHPEILEDHAIDIPGSVVDSALAVFLHRWGDGVELDFYWTGLERDDFGSVSRGE